MPKKSSIAIFIAATSALAISTADSKPSFVSIITCKRVSCPLSVNRLSNIKISSGDLTFSGASGINITGNAGEVDITGGTIDIKGDILGTDGDASSVESLTIAGTTEGTIKIAGDIKRSAAGGEFQISLGSTDTRNLKKGRHVYDILVSSGSTIYTIVSGNIMVQGGISSAP